MACVLRIDSIRDGSVYKVLVVATDDLALDFDFRGAGAGIWVKRAATGAGGADLEDGFSVRGVGRFSIMIGRSFVFIFFNFSGVAIKRCIASLLEGFLDTINRDFFIFR